MEELRKVLKALKSKNLDELNLVAPKLDSELEKLPVNIKRKLGSGQVKQRLADANPNVPISVELFTNDTCPFVRKLADIVRGCYAASN